MDQPTLPVSYSIVYNTPTSRAFDISESTGVVMLASNASLLTGLHRVNLTVRAGVTHSTGDTLTSSTVLGLQLVESEWSTDNVCGLAWECTDLQAAVVENSPGATRVTRLTASSRSTNTADSLVVTYHIVSGDPDNVFQIDPLTVSYHY